MECPICGNSYPDDATRCGQCGVDLTEPKPAAPPLVRGRFMAALAIILTLFIFALNYPGYDHEPYRSVARVRGDMRTLTIALETYYLDLNAYPAWSLKKEENAFGGIKDKSTALSRIPTFHMQYGSKIATLTTPVAYISSYFTDPYVPVKGAPYAYWTPTEGTGFILWSPGPDGIYDLTINNIAQAYTPVTKVPNDFLIQRAYDPSNGTGSRGDVYRVKQ